MLSAKIIIANTDFGNNTENISHYFRATAVRIFQFGQVGYANFIFPTDVKFLDETAIFKVIPL